MSCEVVYTRRISCHSFFYNNSRETNTPFAHANVRGGVQTVSGALFIAKLNRHTQLISGQTGGTNSIMNKPNSMTGFTAKPHLYTL